MRLRWAVLAGAVLVLCAAVMVGWRPALDYVANAVVLPSDPERPPLYQVKTTRNHDFMTRDGVTLSADLHRPVGVSRAPTILVRIPFTNTLFNQLRSDVISRFWAARGYNVVVQGTRGRYRSGGAFEPLVHERDDGIATLHWLSAQPWHDGRLAMWGGSAFGHTQWSISDQTSAAPDAYFVQIASSRFRDAFHPGGAFALETALYWSLNSHGARDRKVDYRQLDRGARALPVFEADRVAAGVEIPFFDLWAKEASDSDYWHRANGMPDAHAAAAPMLLLGGWYDPFLPSMLQDWAALQGGSIESSLIIGPFAHARTIEWPGAKIDAPYRKESVAPALRWFDRHLGVAGGGRDLPRVRIFILGENQWRSENEWPLARTVYTPFYLTEGGKLDREEPMGPPAEDRYTYDPGYPTPTAGGAMLGKRAGVVMQPSIGARADVLSYVSAPLADALEVTGPVKALLTVSTDAPSTDFTAKLILIRPDGVALNLADGVLRRTYEPDVRAQIEIDMGAIGVLAPAGAKLRLDISSSNFPRFDRNPNTGESAEAATRFRIARQTLWRGRGIRSYLVLPVIPR